MSKFGTKKSVVIVLILICSLQLILSLYWCEKKEYLFFDEVFSYAAANNEESIFFEFEENQWMDESWYDNYMGVSSDHRFEYRIPYRNQIRDVHPPLFYFFLHTACSMIPGEFSFMAGMSFNILFFIGSTIGLYFLGKELFGDSSHGLVTGLVYATSFCGLNTVVFVRMYMLMTFFTVCHVLVYLKYLEKEQITIKGYVLLGLTLVGGVLSHYYFLFVAFCIAVWYTLKFFSNKKFAVLIKYLSTIIISAVTTLLIWPAMLTHLFGAGRGKEAQSNLVNLIGYANDIKMLFGVLNNDMFTKMLPVILLGIFGLWIICKRKKMDVLNRERTIKILMITFVSSGYFLLVAKVAPYKVDRYVMPIYPLIHAVVVGICHELFSRLINKKIAALLCVFGLVGLSAVHMVHSGIPYTYVKNPDNVERQAIVEDHCDKYAIYISDNGECHHFTSAQILRNYKAFYHLYDLTTVEQTRKDLEILQNEETAIVYVSKSYDMEEVGIFLGNVLDTDLTERVKLLDEDETWSVYLIEL